MSSTSIKALAMVQEEVLKLENQVADLNLAKQGINAGKDENDKVCKELENVKLEVENVKLEILNVKVEMKDFKNQVMEKLEALIMKTPDPYSCIGCSMGSFCLDGKPVGCPPPEKAMVRADSNITKYGKVIVYAGDTGIGYVRDDPTLSYVVYWKKAGVQKHINHGSDCSNMVYTCNGNKE